MFPPLSFGDGRKGDHHLFLVRFDGSETCPILNPQEDLYIYKHFLPWLPSRHGRLLHPLNIIRQSQCATSLSL
jgi:hypothetical protein